MDDASRDVTSGRHEEVVSALTGIGVIPSLRRTEKLLSIATELHIARHQQDEGHHRAWLAQSPQPSGSQVSLVRPVGCFFFLVYDRCRQEEVRPGG